MTPLTRTPFTLTPLTLTPLTLTPLTLTPLSLTPLSHSHFRSHSHVFLVVAAVVAGPRVCALWALSYGDWHSTVAWRRVCAWVAL